TSFSFESSVARMVFNLSMKSVLLLTKPSVAPNFSCNCRMDLASPSFSWVTASNLSTTAALLVLNDRYFASKTEYLYARPDTTIVSINKPTAPKQTETTKNLLIHSVDGT